MDEWLQMMKSTKPAAGEERVLVAGHPEAEVEAVRRVEGIPFHSEVIQYIKDTCSELSVACLI
jgi:LDH2 family malate/lactate/ureidoglycolate dehydrogenase